MDTNIDQIAPTLIPVLYACCIMYVEGVCGVDGVCGVEAGRRRKLRGIKMLLKLVICK